MRILLSSIEQFDALTGQRELFVSLGDLAVPVSKKDLLETLNIGEGPEYILRFLPFDGNKLLITEAEALRASHPTI